MPDYQLGKIYKIVCNTTGKVYYGSTCEPTLARRLAKHVGNFNGWSNGKDHFVSSFIILENNNYQIILVEKYPCDDKMELLKRERYFIENNECVNKSIPSRSAKESVQEYYKENKDNILIQKKKYYEENKNDKKEYSKNHYEENKDKIILYAKIKHNCACGGKYTNASKSTHEKTKTHLNYIANNNIDEQ
jgi:hypothetical protein